MRAFAGPRADPFDRSFPHLHSEELFALLKMWAPDDIVRRQILEENPARCFGF